MNKDEYLKLYEEWTNTNDRARSNEIVDAITNGVADELKKIEDVYDACDMSYCSPINRSDSYVNLNYVDKVRLESMNSCEVKLGLHERGDGRWHNIILNVKWFGDAARSNLAKDLLEHAIRDCDDNILEQQSIIESANNLIAEYTKTKNKHLEKFKAIADIQQEARH